MDDKNKMTVRKRAALWLLLLMVKIIEPVGFSGEYKEELAKFREALEDLK